MRLRSGELCWNNSTTAKHMLQLQRPYIQKWRPPQSLLPFYFEYNNHSRGEFHPVSGEDRQWTTKKKPWWCWWRFGEKMLKETSRPLRCPRHHDADTPHTDFLPHNRWKLDVSTSAVKKKHGRIPYYEDWSGCCFLCWTWRTCAEMYRLVKHTKPTGRDNQTQREPKREE